jgi:Protein of unknown function (DUF3180)
MRRTPWRRLLVAASAAAAFSAGALRLAESQGVTLLPVPVLAWLVVLAIAAVVGVLGWNVRQYSRGKRKGIDMLLAARTVVLATASAYTGALLTGWYAAHILVTLGELSIDARRDVAVILAVVGLVVERWCEVQPPSDDEGAASAASSQVA